MPDFLKAISHPFTIVIVCVTFILCVGTCHSFKYKAEKEKTKQLQLQLQIEAVKKIPMNETDPIYTNIIEKVVNSKK